MATNPKFEFEWLCCLIGDKVSPGGLFRHNYSSAWGVIYLCRSDLIHCGRTLYRTSRFVFFVLLELYYWTLVICIRPTAGRAAHDCDDCLFFAVSFLGLSVFVWNKAASTCSDMCSLLMSFVHFDGLYGDSHICSKLSVSVLFRFDDVKVLWSKTNWHNIEKQPAFSVSTVWDSLQKIVSSTVSLAP